MITKEQIVAEIETTGSFLHHPNNWDDVDFQDLIDLQKEGVIEPLSKTDPKYMNSDYIYVRTGFVGPYK